MKFEKTEYCLPVCPNGVRNRQDSCLHRYEAAADSFRGLVRKRNEDSFAFAWDAAEKNLLAVVADGIGSTGNGDIAGNYAVRLLLHAWKNHGIPNPMRQMNVQTFLKNHFCDP